MTRMRKMITTKDEEHQDHEMKRREATKKRQTRMMMMIETREGRTDRARPTTGMPGTTVVASPPSLVK